MKKYIPKYAIEIGDPEIGLLGFLCIDRLVFGTAHGGIRIKENLSVDELKFLSRTMTYKGCLIGLELGGAKSGIIISDQSKRKEALRAFGHAIEPLVRSKIYIPGMDMGCSQDDIEIIMEAAGEKIDRSKAKGQSHVYTGWGVGVAAEEALNSLKINIQGANVALEGYGRVGSTAAKWLSDKGAKIIAASTKDGAIFNKNGINIDELNKLREIYGDQCIIKYKDAKKIAIKDLLELDVDVLIPCATACSINKDNVNKIKANIICPGSNHPMDYDIEKQLHKKGKFIYPDYVSNCCGILCSWLENELNQDTLYNLVNNTYRHKIKELLTVCGTKGYIRDRTDQVVENRLKIYDRTTAKNALRQIVYATGRKVLPKPIKSKIITIKLLNKFKKLSFVE